MTPKRAGSRACVVPIYGATETGKSAWLKQRLLASKTSLVWDSNGEYAALPEFVAAETCADLVALADERRPRIAFVPRSLRWFDFFCHVAHTAGRYVVAVEELADVSSPGKAPDWWGVLIRRGRHRGLSIYATSQRPQECDKTILGNFTLLHVCMLARAADREYLAREASIPLERIEALRPLDYLEVERGKTNKIRSDRLNF